MAVPEGPTDKRYIGNGVSQVFTIPFLLLAAADLDVFIDGVEISSGFAITDVGNPTSTLTFAQAPSDQTDIYLQLNVPFERLNDYQENGDFLSFTVNRDFDRIWQALKQLLRWSTRSLRLGNFDADGSGWYRAKENGIRNLRDPIDPQDAATKNWAQSYLAEIIGTGQGAVNSAANVLYVTPQGNVRTVQELSGPDGATMLGWKNTSLMTGLSLNGSRKKVCYNGGQLSQLMHDLEDPLCQAIFLKFVGDSITWGMTVLGGAPTSPRSGQLTDVRNNMTSPSWLNLFHQWLGRNYFRLSAPTTIGAGEVSYSRSVDLWPASPLFVLSAFSTSEGIISNTNATLRSFIDYVTDGKSIEFDMYGASFTYVYSQLTNGADYELFVDGISQGVFTTSGTPVFRASRGHNFAIGSHKIKITKRGTVSTALRTEAIRVNKILTVKNDGIIGRSTADWLPGKGLLDESVQTRDKYVFVMLGTNDRAQTNQPTSPSRITENLFSIVNWLNTQRPLANPILLCANEANQDAESPYFYDMNSVRSAISAVATARSIDMVDFYEVTREALSEGANYLADSDPLHPGTLGHYLMFRGISDAVRNADSATFGFGQNTVSRPAYDLNDLSLRGDYYAGSVTLNNPSGESALVRVSPQGDGRVVQLIYPYSGARSWRRTRLQNGAWVSREDALRSEVMQLSGGAMSGVFRVAQYSVGSLPAVTGNTGGFIMVTDTVDGPRPCYSDGLSWKRFDTNSNVS